MSVQQTVPQAEDIDLGALGRAVWRAKGWILGLPRFVGVATFVGLSMVRAALHVRSAHPDRERRFSLHPRGHGQGATPSART